MGGPLCLEFRVCRRAPRSSFVLLAALAAPGTARADVTEVFNLFGEFDNNSTLSGTLTVDTTAGSATAIDAAADGFEFKTITGQSPGLEYTVDADTAGNAAQLSLVFGVHSPRRLWRQLALARHHAQRHVFKGRRRKPCGILARSRAIVLGLDDDGFRWRRPVCRSSRWKSERRDNRISPTKLSRSSLPPASRCAGGSPGRSLYSAKIVKTVDASTRAGPGSTSCSGSEGDGPARFSPTTKNFANCFTNIRNHANVFGLTKASCRELKPKSHAFAAFLIEASWRQEFFYSNRP